MARQELLYIELKADHSDRGPAWIGLATLSRSARTVYFHGKALKRIAGGVVMLDSRVVDDYMTLRGISQLDPQLHKVVTIAETDIARFHRIENKSL